jgi:membrane protease YdiL (CAAX protease family)
MSSSPQEPQLPQIPAAQVHAATYPAAPIEDPPWSGWDVLRIFVIAVLLLFGSLLMIAVVTKLFMYRQTNFLTILTFPLMSFVAQTLAYLLLLAYMVRVVGRRTSLGFWAGIRWNWPGGGIGGLILIGLVTYVALIAFAQLLPWPKKSPFEEFFKRPLDAYAIALLAVSFGPLMEELFFRGFLYPVLARRLGLVFGVFLTALSFALIHLVEYGAWAPVLMVFLIGMVVTIVRAKKQSVAAGFIVHGVYNGVQMGIAFVQTGGFRHLEKLTH